MPRDYAKDQLKTLDRIAKKLTDLEGHLVRVEDSIGDKKHHTAQHEAMKDMREILKKADKVDHYSDKLEKFAGEGRKDPAANHTIYIEEEAPVVESLKTLFNETDAKLAKLTPADGSRIEEYEAMKDYLGKAKEVLKKAGRWPAE